MRARWRILLVVTRAPERGLRWATSESSGLPPRGAALAAGALLHAGGEVRLIDQDAEKLPDRVVCREARLWRADLALLHAGGSDALDDPVPDDAPLEELLQGWPEGGPAVALGPLARRYAGELLQRVPRLQGALAGAAHALLAGPGDLARVPGAVVATSAGTRLGPPPETPPAELEPAWHVLNLESYDAGGGGRRRAEIERSGRSVDLILDHVRHATQRARANHVVFCDRDFLADVDDVRELCGRMAGAAPGVPWSCRVRADHVDPMRALTLFHGGCREVLVTAPVDVHAPGLAPMDDPERTRIESAVEALRVTGMSVRVEHVIGRPGHSRDMLAAWQRWFADRRMAVVPRVRLVHAGARAPGVPSLAEARNRAGCFDNELWPRDVELAVRRVSDPAALALERP